jgi:hypothetical protein
MRAMYKGLTFSRIRFLVEQRFLRVFGGNLQISWNFRFCLEFSISRGISYAGVIFHSPPPLPRSVGYRKFDRFVVI